MITLTFCDDYSWDGELKGSQFVALMDNKVIHKSESFSELREWFTPENLEALGVDLSDGIVIGDRSFTREELSDHSVF